MSDFFKDYHPYVNVCFFISVIGFTMFTNHIILQLISIIGAIIYLFILRGFSESKKVLIGGLVVFLLMGLLNPIVNHRGVTILTYFKNGNPLTLESIVYGFSAGLMLYTVIIWFSSHNKIMTSDRIMFVFGKILPSLSLIFSMVLRFVPLYQARIKDISYARRCIGLDISQGNIIERIKHGLAVFSIFVTWALESAIETADSMKSRGFGLPGRTAFSLFYLEKRDVFVLFYMIFTDIILIYLFVNRTFKMVYYPSLKIARFTSMTIIGFILFGLLCLLPSLLSLEGELRWKYFV